MVPLPASNSVDQMDRAVARVSSFARSWGCTGVVALTVTLTLSACGPKPSLPEPPVSPVAAGTGAVPQSIPAPATFEGTAPVTSAATLPVDEGTWAIVVGIDDYPGTGRDLRSANNDAGDMEELLTRAGVAPERRLRLADRQATAAGLLDALDWLAARAGPGSTAVFFFAGHVRHLGGSTEALVGADGRLVRDTEVASHLAHLQASKTWLVLASCYGGGFVEALAPGRILTAASPADRLAYENLALQRSYLGEYLVRRALLEGRAPATVEAAFAWAESALRREHPARAPVQFDRLDGDLALGLAAAPSRAPARPEPSPRPRVQPATTTTTPREESCVVTVGSLLQCPD